MIATSYPPPKPRRLRRSRAPCAVQAGGPVYVGRPTMWTNPFTGRCSGHAKSVILHKAWLDGQIGALTLERMGFHPAEISSLERLRARVLASIHRLAGHDLACWCPLTSEWCHAETLLKLAATATAPTSPFHRSLRPAGSLPGHGQSAGPEQLSESWRA